MIKAHETVSDEECLLSLYRQSKIAGFARINFLSAKLCTDFDTTLGILKGLSDSGLVRIENYGHIFLTEYGLSKVRSLQNRPT